jgi:hypothetical protein
MAHNRKALGFLLSVDFGLLRDHTAFSIMEEIEEFDLRSDGFGPAIRHNERKFIDVVMLKRMPLGVGYPDITRVAANFVRELPERPRRPYILCDATGVGRAPVQFMRKEGLWPVIAVSFTSGLEERRLTSYEYHVPKKNLVSATVLALQDGRLRIAPEIEHASLLQEELRNFKLKIRESGSEAFEAGRESIHDDLVSAVMMGAWFADKPRPQPPRFMPSEHMGR